MKRKFYWLLIISFLIGFTAYAKEKNYPIMTENGKSYYLYNVQKSEGLYAISQRFNVPQALIIEANPGVEQGLKLGQQIKVPKLENNSKKSTTSIKVGKNQHLVKAKETLYSLSKKYNCTVDELLELNPWATHLTIGSVLNIPAKKSTADHKQKPGIEANASDYTNTSADSMSNSDVVTSQTDAAVKRNKSKKKNIWSWFTKKDKQDTTQVASIDTVSVITIDSVDSPKLTQLKESEIKVAILLPFMLDSVNRDASMNRFIDFYQGCLIAIDSLAQMGLSTEVYAFDIGKDELSLAKALNHPSLSQMNLIIGPAYQDQVTKVATYAAKHKIPTIIPFASNVPGINNNPYLIEVVTPQKELYNNLVQKCLYLFNNKHVIFVKPYMIAQYNKVDFANLLTEGMNATSTAYTVISDAQLTKDIDSIASLYPEQECVVVMPSTHGVAVNKLGEALSHIKQANVSVFSFPEWNNLGIDELYNKKMYQFSSYYTSFNDPRILDFYHRVKEKFGIPKNIQQTPNFALFGFDICYFFMQQYQINGKHFTQYLPTTEVNGLQMNFLFEQVENGGYWNVGIIIKQIDKEGITDL